MFLFKIGTVLDTFCFLGTTPGSKDLLKIKDSGADISKATDLSKLELRLSMSTVFFFLMIQ